jgi:hypothetical protein
MNHYKIIRFAEYAAISASVLGAIAAISTQQPAYAVAPLSVSVALNLLSRQQQEQRLDQHFNQTIHQVNQRLDRLDQRHRIIQKDLKTLLPTQTSEIPESSEDTVTATNVEISQIFENGINPRFQSFSEEIKAAQRRLEQLEQQRSQFATSSGLEALSANIQQLQKSLTDIAAENEAKFEHRLQDLTQTQQQLFIEQQAPLANRINRLDNDVIELDSDLTQLRQDLQALIDQFRSQIPSTSTETSGPDFSHIIPQLPTDENYELEINLGIDFGTGFTKVCFRDLAQDYSEIVTFADPEATQNGLSLEQTLIPTKLAILQDGTLLTGLTVAEWQANRHPIKQSIDFIKMRLAHLDLPSESEWRLEHLPELDDPSTVESLCAYYLSAVIDRAQKWIHTNRPDLFVNQTVRWSVNIGVPVEYSDSPALARFKRVLSLAWVLNYTPTELETHTIDSLNKLIAHLQHWMVENSISDLDCNTTPEIAAAVWSFLSSREAQDGFYTFFDIGDGTLDGAAFRFWREGDGDLYVDFYQGKVEPLGVTAFTQQAATELDSSPESIRQALIDTSDQDLHQKMQQSQIRRDVQKLVASVVFKGSKRHHDSRRYLASDEIGDNMKIFVGGGGGNTSFFKRTIQSTYRTFRHDRAGIPPYQIRQIPPPKDLSVNGLDPQEFNRFAVAYGLCIPSWEGPKIQLPSQIEINEQTLHQAQPEPVSYEETRDMM